MNHIIIGTAGHIDHGKTALVKALTGQDADRLPEEKARGITIDLGYAWCDLGTIRAGFIDVPGHEKLIANMVSGVTGMDMVLFTVAADEGMKPQSFEHLDIMDILGVRRGIVVITKADLADNDRIDIVREQIRQETVHTFLENAPVISTSIKTSEGIEELLTAMQHMAEEIAQLRSHIQNPESAGIPRLPVDRSFSLPGFGTIVTGTLLSGTIHQGDQLAVYPGETPCRVRSVQSYGEEVETASGGQRCALNLPKLSTNEAARGTVIAPAGALKTSRMMNVRIRVSEHFNRPLESGMRAHLLIGTTRVVCRVFLFAVDQNGQQYAQLRLEEPVCALPGDRFILRFYSPLETIGGGTVIEAEVRKTRMSDRRALEKIRYLDDVLCGRKRKKEIVEDQRDKENTASVRQPVPEQLKKQTSYLLSEFEKAGFKFVSINSLDLSENQFNEQKTMQTLRILERRGDIVRLDQYHYTTAALANEARKKVLDYFKENDELTTGALRDLLETNRTSARALLEYLDRKKITRQQGGAAMHVMVK
ncbi:MAG: selenocysteine-specific translation elongation factor [Lachnospiraceae bacterium]|nr:selenocysteine-specific translation elongation factor [Lachnospiraceae bacterium]